MEELIKRIFATRNAAHLEHWNTESYAKHMALGAFYDEVPDLLDALVEAHQGINGKVGFPKIENVSGDIIEILKDDLVYMHKNREKICDKLPVLSSLLDIISALYSTTIYKLKDLH